MDGGVAPVRPDAGGLSPIKVIWRRKWAILVLALLLTGAAGLVLKRLPLRYTASTSVMVDARRMQVIEGPSVLSPQTLDFDRLRTYIEKLRSPTIALAVVQELGLDHLPAFCTPAAGGLAGLLGLQDAAPNYCRTPADAADRLLTMVQGGNDGRSYIIRITAEAGSADLAAAIANAYARAYVAADRAQTTDATAEADRWLTSYLNGLRTQMVAADRAVEQYRTDNQLITLRGETVVAQRLAELNTQLTVATGELTQKQAALQEVQAMARTGASLDGSAPAVLASSLVQNLIEKQSQLQASLADLRTHFDDSYPSVKAAAAQLAKVDQAIRTEVAKVIAGLSQEVASLGARRASLEAAVAQLQSQTGDQASAGVRLLDLQREAETRHRLYETMATRLHEIEAERMMQWPSSTVLVEAQPPKFASFPRIKMMLTGIFIVALGVGAGVAFGLELASPRFRDSAHLEAETGVPVLGVFPRPPRGVKAARLPTDRPESRQAEMLGFLLVNLSRSQVPGPGEGRVVLIASALPGEGRSSLALALAQTGKRVGLSVGVLDCDRRSDGLAALLKPGRPASLALQSCAAGEVSVPLARAADGLLRRMRSEHDLVLVDAPAVLAVSDALSLAPLIDHAILAIDLGRVRRSAAQAALRSLGRAGIAVTGIVLTKVDAKQFGRDDDGFHVRGTRQVRRRARATIDA
jgi:uncharacterized protein involved in exopolysaccharide biosynthesis/Mrp family chromosome partitioning ATPase